MCEICSKLTIKYGAFIASFEQISRIILMFPALNKINASWESPR